MPRTTIDVDASVLRQVKQVARREGKSLARVVSELLAKALGESGKLPAPEFQWSSRPMRALVDLEDKDAVYAAMERE